MKLSLSKIGKGKKAIWGIACFITGIFLMLCSASFFCSILRILGAVMFISILFRLIFSIKSRNGVRATEIINGFLIFLFGILMFLYPNATLEMVYFVLGFLFVLGNFQDFLNSRFNAFGKEKVKLCITLVFDTVCSFFAIILILVPSSVLRAKGVIAGALLVIRGGRLLVSEVKNKKEKHREKDEYIEGEFVDKSDEL